MNPSPERYAMKFVINLTIREIRSSWKSLLFFFLCIAIGVGSVVALRALTRNLSVAVGGDARELLTADFTVTSTSAFSPDDLTRIDSVVEGSGIVDGRGETIELAIAARPADRTMESIALVGLKGIDETFPLVGEFRLSDGKPFSYSLLENEGAVVSPELLEDLGVKIGDEIIVGETRFRIRATFSEEPGRASGFSVASRVFVSNDSFDKAGINSNTGRVRRRILFRTDSNPTQLVNDLREALKGTTLTVQYYKETQQDLGEQFARTEDYLSLTGLLILVLGGVGVWNVARAFINQKRKSVAVLKCLGAGGTRVISVYLLQILTLGLIGSVFGVVLAQLSVWLIGFRFAESLPRTMSYAVPFSAALQGIALGVLVSMLFSALPLLHIRTIKPRLLLHDDSGEKTGRIDKTKWLIGFASLSGLVALAAWQAGSVRVGTIFLGGLAVTSAVLFAASALLIFLLKRFGGYGSFFLRQAVNSLYRPGNQTRVILLAVGLGAFVILGVQSLQTNLLRVFDLSNNENFPSIFFGDIQKSQIEGFVGLLKSRTGEEPEKIPTVRARIVMLNGEPFDFQDREVRQRQGQIGREFAVTYRAELDENESIIDGEWWGEKAQRPEVAQVSVNDGFADRLDIRVGDYLTFEISGRKINAEVANLRKIDFSNSRTAFVFVFRPGSLDNAPQSYIVTMLKKMPERDRARLKNAVLDRFPNVQIFDVLDIAKLIRDLINNFVLAISFVGSFVMLSGILILIGSVALTKSQRVYENAILKTLGAKRRTLSLILLAEYGLLGLVAGLIGAGFATALSYAVSVWVFDIEWEFDPVLMAGGVAATALVVMAVGTAVSFDVLFRKPLGTLRSH
ncbi:MAG: ABC transporter permease [Aridibacter famidurans]|nr:ABC transporter permease [Aridibacter famidurans]